MSLAIAPAPVTGFTSRPKARAQNLDAMLEVKSVTLPAPVRSALLRRRVIRAERLPAPPQPGRLLAQAITNQAFILAEHSGDKVVVDLGDLEAARHSEQEANDRVAVLAAAKDAVDTLACRAVDRHALAVVKALQTRYSAVAKTFVEAARRLPGGLTADLALRLGGQVREDWLAVEDSMTEMAGLRELVATVGNDKERTEPTQSTMDAMWVKSPLLGTHRTVRGPAAYAFGDPGSREFLVALAQLVDAESWWAPTLAEARALASSWRPQRPANVSPR